ncbi:7TM GPCR serpentine receptor class x (Srx) domain-containing protein [Caenorhabditis elegans]|uniref:7TM GPCR serpentine receptor class x (Srx) domain-containing protein n=1 Tax=Caenorhabditis elegans TaxID=6239 RepID=Q7YX06_CAEEL|nr:7TM GPCR serpentine receptor class x (Srx) domain-containing protein [Caenorhabditis elegans]CAE17843.1 7TM GPCR serpentine receptor class x (Srx) domain-containing protein [Caenorhabditis elegans]|eukprot:NP_001023915.1 Serpentine Receptor, class X [Caenorhabditis elegans]
MSFSPDADPLNWFAASVMTINGVFGITCNTLIIASFIRSPTERTSFNLICSYRAVGNCIILLWGFLGTFVPITLFGDTLFPPIYQFIVLTCVNSLYAGLQYCGFLIAINRFCAMYIPMFYSTLFGVKITFILTTLIFVYRIVKIIMELIHYIPLQCFSSFSSYDISWAPAMDERCRKYGGVVDESLLILGTLVAINCATFVKIYLFYKATELDSREVKEKMKKNRILFIQTIIQDLTYIIDLIFTFQLSGLISARYWTFISGSFIWQCVHSFDGLIMIMFNEKLTLFKRSFFSSSSDVQSVAPATKLFDTVATNRNYNVSPIG